MNSVQKMSYHAKSLRTGVPFGGILFIIESYLEFHFKCQPAGTIGIKQEPCAILIFDIEGLDLVPASQLFSQK